MAGEGEDLIWDHCIILSFAHTVLAQYPWGGVYHTREMREGSSDLYYEIQ